MFIIIIIIMQWLPYRWYFQIFFIIYRWVVAGFFAGWLIAAGLSYINDGDAKFFILLTNWGFLLFNVHLIWSTIVSTVDFCREFICCRQSYIESDAGEIRSTAYERDLETPTGCCGRSYNKIKWYHMIQWALFVIGTEIAVAITIIYWPLIYNPNDSINGIRFNTHGTQAIIAVIELLAAGVPVRFYHFYFSMIFGAIFVVFSGIYYAAGGMNLAGDPFIYSILDYGNNPGGAVGIIFGVVFLLLPIVHVLFYLAYVARYWVVYLIYSKCMSSTPDHTRLAEGKQKGPEIGTELKEL